MIWLYLFCYGPVLFGAFLWCLMREGHITLKQLVGLLFVCLTPVVNLLATIGVLMYLLDSYLNEYGDTVVIQQIKPKN